MGWTSETGMQSIRDLLVAGGVDMTGWFLSGASAISADGTIIVGVGENPDGVEEAWIARIAAVPEPSTWAMISMLTLSVAFFFWRQRHQQQQRWHMEVQH